MSRRSWRYMFVLLALGLLASLTVGSAVAAQPGNGNGKANGQKNKPGKVVHVNGTLQAAASATSITVVPKARGKSGKQGAAQTFTVNGDTKIVGEGVQEGTKVTLSPQLAPANARVNIVGRAASGGGNPVASVIVLLGPADQDDDKK